MSTISTPLIEARRLGKRYGDVVALEDVSFSVAQGEVFGLLAVIQSQPQYATVEAVVPTSVYSLDLHELIDSSGVASQPISVVLSMMARHLRELADEVIAARQQPT